MTPVNTAAVEAPAPRKGPPMSRAVDLDHAPCTRFDLMAVETLHNAVSAGWGIRVRCGWGPRDGMKRVRECVYGGEVRVY